MVFKPLSHLARRSTKAFTHGYAQSLAAASQSSYASANTPLGQFNNHRPAGRGTPSRRDVTFSTTNLPNLLVKNQPPLFGQDPSADTGTDVLFSSWPRHQPHESDRQILRLGRDGAKERVSHSLSLDSSKIPAGQISGEGLLLSPGLDALTCPVSSSEVETTYPTLTPDSASGHQQTLPLKTKQNQGEERGIAVGPLRSLSAALEAHSKSLNPHQDAQGEDALPRLTLPQVGPATLSSWDHASLEAVEAGTSTHSTDKRQAHIDHIVSLDQSGRHADIPPVFESLLSLGLPPSTIAYNALLSSVAHLALSSFEAGPKALDVYADMLRRQVQPDSRTYSILLELLAVRATAVAELESSLQGKKLRFGTLRQSAAPPYRLFDDELSVLEEDNSLVTALRLFNVATDGSRRLSLSAEAYCCLTDACAAHGNVDEMIRIYAHMEEHKILPIAGMYPPMIRAFSASGDLRSAVECYNEYKHLVARNESTQRTPIDRIDSRVYAAVIASYLQCGREDGAERFLKKIINTLEPYENALQEARDVIFSQAVLTTKLASGDLYDALEQAMADALSSNVRDAALDAISASAADRSEVAMAAKAHNLISDTRFAKASTISLLAMHLRLGDVASARHTWHLLSAIPEPDQSFVEPTVMYAAALLQCGRAREGLEQARQAFRRIRTSNGQKSLASDIQGLIDEGIEGLSWCLARDSARPEATTTVALMWMMVENGGLILPLVEKNLAALGADEIALLDPKDLELVLFIEAGIISKSLEAHDVAHTARFEQLLRTALDSDISLCPQTVQSVESTLDILKQEKPSLISLWTAASSWIQRSGVVGHVRALQSFPGPTSPSTGLEGVDPYARDLDARGSSIIVDQLETSFRSFPNTLNESLAKFKNIRRAGRHPRYVAYAKLIAAAAREGRTCLINDLYEMAKHDVPLTLQFPVVCHGWSNIYDAMISAYLTVGNRSLAESYHDRLLQIGVAPSANTYGLYITTLKDSGQTFDEASEAVKIFQRARSEGVEPTSFLYNALIGKLGKARRIDDCLFYFAEMRAQGIRPTSVTYGTIVNALCRVSDERFAQDLFDEMESMPNYKPRPAPYNSMMQFFLTSKRDGSKVLEYYQRMQSRGIKPTMHTYKLLIDTYATLEPINLTAAEGVLDTIRTSGQAPEAVHYASLIHAKGCVLHDMDGATQIFERITCDPHARHHACLYQAYFESLVANHRVRDTGALLEEMQSKRVEITPYIGNTLIHGWTMDGNIDAAKAVYDSICIGKREPSTYEAMTRGFMAAKQREGASAVVQEMLSRGYPSAVSNKVLDLLNRGTPGEVTAASG